MGMLTTGEDLIRRAGRFKPGLFSARFLNDAVFNLSMRDPEFKAQLFRFIDVLPSLKTREEAVAHLREYLLPRYSVRAPATDSPLWFERLGKFLLDAAPGPAVRTVRAGARHMANTFIAGATLAETMEVLSRLIAGRRGFCLDVLGEKTTSEEGAERYVQACLDALDGLAGRFGRNARDALGNPVVHLVVKVSSLYSRFDPIAPEECSQASRRQLRRIFRKASELGAAVTLDMEHYQYRDLTCRIFMELLEEEEFHEFPRAGIAQQAYLKDSGRCLRALVDWARRRERPITVRLVKGAYWDHEVMLAQRNNWPAPVFTRKWQTDAQYEKLTDILLENSRWTHPAIGSHNVRSLAHALEGRSSHAVAPEHFDVQMLYGMGEEIQRALVEPPPGSSEPRVPLHVYVPFGELIPGMGYFVRRLLENASNESFLRAFDRRAPVEELLRDPVTVGRREGPSRGERVAEERNDSETQAPQQSERLHAAGQAGRKFSRAGGIWRTMNMAVTDFSKAGEREAMQKALADARARFGAYRFGLRIGGEWLETGARIESRNVSKPSEVIGWTSGADQAHIDAALGAAREAFREWRQRSAADRASYLYRVAGEMKRRLNELAALEVYEAGKTWHEAHADVDEAIDYLNFYGKRMEQLGGERVTQKVLGEENTAGYIPRGTVAVIAPWNFPLAILTGMAAAAVVAGNAVLLKPSSETPLLGGELTRMFEEAGLPPGVLNFVPFNGAAIGDHLVESPLLDMVAFTGSRDVGLRIYEKLAAARPGRRSVPTIVLEMGGKNAIIIDRTADLDEAVPGVLYSAFGYQGQKCSACSRLIVLESVYDELMPKLIESARSLRVGPADSPGTDVGPVINERAYRSILEYIAAARRQGARTLLSFDPEAHDGEQPHSDADGYYIGPAILEVQPDNVIAREEVFGPVLAVLKVRDFDAALQLLNDTEYGLTGGVYTRTPSHIERFKREALVGNRYVNRPITGAVVERQPFGGFKMSGAGSKAGGADYLLHFMLPISNAESTDRRGHVPGIEEARDI